MNIKIVVLNCQKCNAFLNGQSLNSLNVFVFSIVIIFSFFKQKMTSVFTIANMQWQPDQIIRPPAQLNVWVKTHRYNTKLHKMWISGEQSATGSHSEPGIASLCPPYHTPSSYLKQNHHQPHNARPTKSSSSYLLACLSSTLSSLFAQD